MFRKTMFAPLLAASAMALTASPVYAGKADRAREAIAAAEAKIHSAETMGAGSEMPHEAADARASLALAKEKLSAGHKSESIEEAIHAQQLADTAIGAMQHHQDQAMAAERNAHSQDVAAANQRAEVAQQQAANSAADAAAARNAAIAAQNQPAQVETTVTTQQPAARASHRTAVRRTTTTKRTVVAPSTTTTTTVKQAVN
jgi:hypothetical protein